MSLLSLQSGFVVFRSDNQVTGQANTLSPAFLIERSRTLLGSCIHWRPLFSKRTTRPLGDSRNKELRVGGRGQICLVNTTHRRENLLMWEVTSGRISTSALPARLES